MSKLTSVADEAIRTALDTIQMVEQCRADWDALSATTKTAIARDNPEVASFFGFRLQ